MLSTKSEKENDSMGGEIRKISCARDNETIRETDRERDGKSLPLWRVNFNNYEWVSCKLSQVFAAAHEGWFNGKSGEFFLFYRNQHSTSLNLPCFGGGESGDDPIHTVSLCTINSRLWLLLGGKHLFFSSMYIRICVGTAVSGNSWSFLLFFFSDFGTIICRARFTRKN